MNIHEETLKIARNLIEKDPSLTDWVISKFPELKGEDERIRKEILDCFRAMKQQGCFPSKHKDQYDSWIAWLEKQGQTFTKKDVDDAYLKGVCDAKQELEKQGKQSDSDVKDYNSIDPHFGKPIDMAPIVIRDFNSVFSREKVEEIDKRIEKSQKLYNVKLRDAMRKVKDFPMTD